MKKYYIFLLIAGFFTTSAFSQSPDILLNGTVSAQNNQIKNVAEPTDGADAVNKDYLLQVLDTTNISGNLQSVLDIGSFAELILNSENLYGIELNLTGGDDPELRYNGIRSVISGTDGRNTAVYGESSGESLLRNYGVWGVGTGGQFLNAGTLGTSNGTVGTYNYGVWGIARNASTESVGVVGYAGGVDPANTSAKRGVYGSAIEPSAGINYGVTGVARGSTVLNIAGGFYAEGGDSTDMDYGDNWGIEARASSLNENGQNIGVRAIANNASTNYGIYSTAYGGTTNYAGYFEGDLKVTGGKIDSDVTLVNPPTEDMDAVNKGYLMELLASYQTQIDNLQAQIDIEDVTTNGLVAYFPFSGNANDISGNNNNGTVSGATLTSDRNGSANKAYEFIVDENGGWGIPQQEILVNYDDAMNSNSITLSAWIYLRSKPGQYGNRPSTIFGRWADGNANEVFRFQITNTNEIYLQISNASSSGNTENDSAYFQGGSVPYETWTHVLVTYNGSVGRVYQNGEMVAEQTIGVDFNLGGSALNIGSLKASNGTWYLFDGKLDELGYWDRVLTENEISDLYNP